MARDRGGPPLSFIMPIYPMIDDTNTTTSSRAITDVGIWDRSGNIEAWAWYLCGQEADGYAAPARAEDLSPACRRPSSTSARSTCFWTRTSPSCSG